MSYLISDDRKPKPTEPPTPASQGRNAADDDTDGRNGRRPRTDGDPWPPVDGRGAIGSTDNRVTTVHSYRYVFVGQYVRARWPPTYNTVSRWVA
jgi:hypothetical protein